ncbi:PAS fold [Methylobacterium sp. UNCCL125]|nr:PAS fold [Methylobacterium sp. UNCCL125]
MACLDKEVACRSAIPHERDAGGSGVRFTYLHHFATKLVHALVVGVRLIAGGRFGSAVIAYGPEVTLRRRRSAAGRELPDCSGSGLLTQDAEFEDGSVNAHPASRTPYGRFRAELCEREASGTSLAPFGEGSDIAGPAPMDRPPVHGSTAFVHAVLENMDQGILMLCPNNRVLLQNRRARELLGPSPDELRDGEPFDEIRWPQFHRDDRSGNREHRRAVGHLHHGRRRGDRGTARPRAAGTLHRGSGLSVRSATASGLGIELHSEPHAICGRSSLGVLHRGMMTKVSHNARFSDLAFMTAT